MLWATTRQSWPTLLINDIPSIKTLLEANSYPFFSAGNLGYIKLVHSSGNWSILNLFAGEAFHLLNSAGAFLASDFTGADTSGAGPNPLAISITWDTVIGVQTPATNLTFYDGDGFFGIANEIAVDRNLPSEGSWSTNLVFEMSSTTQSLELTSLVLNWRVTSNSGTDNTSTSKTTTWTASITGSTSGLMGTVLNAGTPGSPSQERTLDMSGNSLNASETYTLTLTASATGWGHNASLEDLTLNGNVQYLP